MLIFSIISYSLCYYPELILMLSFKGLIEFTFNYRISTFNAFFLIFLIFIVIPIGFIISFLLYFRKTIFDHSKPIQKSYKLAVSAYLKSLAIQAFFQIFEFVSRIFRSKIIYILFRFCGKFLERNPIGMLEMYYFFSGMVIHMLCFIMLFALTELFIYHKLRIVDRDFKEFLKLHRIFLVIVLIFFLFLMILFFLIFMQIREALDEAYFTPEPIVLKDFPSLLLCFERMLYYAVFSTSNLIE